jgi:hypothetical protein
VTYSGKLQKHEIFENELNANHDRVEYLEDIGAKMIENQHYASDDIKFAQLFVSFYQLLYNGISSISD